MHGLGDGPQSFVELFTNSGAEIFPKTTKYVLLRAPTRPVTINFGQMTASWFDIFDFQFSKDPKQLFDLE
jgi:predicted esterase